MAEVGRPMKFESPGHLQILIDAYFADTPKDEWTITGLALALNTSRQTLLDYEEKDEYFDTIKNAKLKVENGYEIDLKKQGRTGTIFALKNFGWKDRNETDLTTNGKDLPSPIIPISNVSTDNGDNKDTESSEKD